MTPRCLTLILCYMLAGCSSLRMSTETVDERISQVTCMNDVEELAEGIYAEPNTREIYAHLLTRANQGDSRVDVVLASLDGRPRTTFPYDMELLCARTATDPQLVDVIGRYRDWQWSKSASVPETHNDVDAESVSERTCLTNMFEVCAGERSGPPRCISILWYVALTEHYELLEGRLSQAEVVQSFDVNIDSLRAELPYLRFDPELRKYVLDEEASRLQTPVDPRLQQLVGRPAGPAPGWEGKVYVGAEP